MLNPIRTNSRPVLALALAIPMAMALAPTARAADETGKWYMMPMGGYTFLDNARNVDDDYHVGFGLGYHASEFFSLELNGLWADFEGDNGRTLHQGAYSLDGLFVFSRASKYSPYLSLGGGYLQNNFAGPRNWGGPMAQIGFGIMMDAGDDDVVFQFRPEVKYRHDWPDTPHGKDDAGDVLVNLGFAFLFGGGKAPPPVVAAPTPPPPPPPPPAPPPPVDSDGDGVPDSADRCSGTPAGTQVNALGCPLEPVILRGVEFATNSATLTEGSRPVLNAVADDLKIHPRLKVELQGHTDSRGTDALNLDLSQRRADSVRDYLISVGVNPQNLVAKGYGEAQPIADNTTANGRADNRRVVMKVLENPNNAEVSGDVVR